MSVPRRVHFIGICGTAMATLAAMLQRRGDRVQGSDAHVYPPMSDFLRREGIQLFEGYDPAHLLPAPDLVVVGNAVSRGNPELEAVLTQRLRYASLPETIRETFLWDSRPVVIAGTHGKTTTTALTGWLLTACGADPSVLVGGIARNFGDGGSSYRLGGGRPFVIEGDEYDSAYFDKTAKFLKYLPDIAVINNIEFDHADIYRDLDEVRTAFRRLVQLVPATGLTLIGADSPEAAALAATARSRVERFGLSEGCEWQACELTPEATATTFTLRTPAGECHRLTVPLLGAHNVRNTLAAIAVGHACGLRVPAMAEALRGFLGVRRRLEVTGAVRDITVYDDFAHHPTAVAETIAAMRAAHPGQRVWAVFEPRSASSCRRVFQEAFVEALAGADEVVLAAVFRSSLAAEERLDESALVASLSARGVRARFLPDIDRIVETIAHEARAGDHVVVMSNGGFGGIHGRLVAAIGAV